MENEEAPTEYLEEIEAVSEVLRMEATYIARRVFIWKTCKNIDYSKNLMAKKEIYLDPAEEVSIKVDHLGGKMLG